MTSYAPGQLYYDSGLDVYYTLVSCDRFASPAGLLWTVLCTYPRTGRSGLLENFRMPAAWNVGDSYTRVQ